LIGYVANKLRMIRGGVFETFTREADKEPDSKLPFNKFLDMLIRYYKIELSSTEKSSLARELDDEGLITKEKGGEERVLISRFLKISKIMSPLELGGEMKEEKKKIEIKGETLNMDTTESTEVVSMLADIGKEIVRQRTTPEKVFDIRQGERFITFT
jgi:hypothetical protein